MQGVTLRAGSSAVAFAAIAAIALLLVGDAVVRGSWAVAARLAGPAALIVWAAWLLMVRPSIRVLPDRAVIVNVGRVIEVPWVRVVDIRRRLQLIFDLDDGGKVEAWGSPFASKRTDRKSVDDTSLEALRAAWMSWSAASDAALVRRPDVPALALGAAGAVAAVLSLTVGGAL